MAIFRHTADLPPEALGAVVAIGNFDGVHLGHQAVIAAALRRAAPTGAPVAVLTFEPHPRRFFRPHDPPFQLTSMRLKARLLEALGVHHVLFLTFNEALSHLSAADFVRHVLVRDLAARHVMVGADFAFGHRRQGDGAVLRAMGDELGFRVDVLAPVAESGGAAYSSTAIRACLRAGDPAGAARLLGRYWEIEGRVQPGARLGHKLGFPTANIGLDDFLHPAYGVYAVRAGIDRGERTLWHPGVANVGVRPMVDGKTPLLEVHLFDLEPVLYGQHLRVALVEHLRAERMFDDLAAMTVQMRADAARARALLAGHDWEAGWPAEAPARAPPAR